MRFSKIWPAQNLSHKILCKASTVCLYWEINIPLNFEKTFAACGRRKTWKCPLPDSITEAPSPSSTQGLTSSPAGQSLTALGNDWNDPKISISRIYRVTVIEQTLKTSLHVGWGTKEGRMWKLSDACFAVSSSLSTELGSFTYHCYHNQTNI